MWYYLEAGVFFSETSTRINEYQSLYDGGLMWSRVKFLEVLVIEKILLKIWQNIRHFESQLRKGYHVANYCFEGLFHLLVYFGDSFPPIDNSFEGFTHHPDIDLIGMWIIFNYLFQRKEFNKVHFWFIL